MAKLVIGTDKTVVVPAVVKEVTPVEKYALLSRVKDDSNNEIGTVCGYHTDANNQKYAVVCLDARYRLENGYVLSDRVEVTGLALLTGFEVYDNTDTATSNCTKILDFATANGYTSTAVSHCRSKSFVIEGTTYYGQLPTIAELFTIFMNRTVINTKDTSASIWPARIIPNDKYSNSSSQYTSGYQWGFIYSGTVQNVPKNFSQSFVSPILEIPMD